jgi:Ca2+-binding RTX toxin-like protein
VVTIGGALQALALLELGDGERALMLIQLTGELYGEANVTITNDFLVDTFADFRGDVNVQVIPVEDFTGPLVLFNEVEIKPGDILLGESGRDTFWFDDGDGVDVILDFKRGVDQLKLERGEPIRQTVVTDVNLGPGLLIEHGGDGDAVFLKGVDQLLTLVSSGGGYDTYS